MKTKADMKTEVQKLIYLRDAADPSYLPVDG